MTNFFIKDGLRSTIESFSDGKLTVIYDKQGRPSIMMVIPRMTIREVLNWDASNFIEGIHYVKIGDEKVFLFHEDKHLDAYSLDDVHPAFQVINEHGEIEVLPEIYVGVYLSTAQKPYSFPEVKLFDKKIINKIEQIRGSKYSEIYKAIFEKNYSENEHNWRVMNAWVYNLIRSYILTRADSWFSALPVGVDHYGNFLVCKPEIKEDKKGWVVSIESRNLADEPKFGRYYQYYNIFDDENFRLSILRRDYKNRYNNFSLVVGGSIYDYKENLAGIVKEVHGVEDILKVTVKNYPLIGGAYNVAYSDATNLLSILNKEPNVYYDGWFEFDVCFDSFKNNIRIKEGLTYYFDETIDINNVDKFFLSKSDELFEVEMGYIGNFGGYQYFSNISSVEYSDLYKYRGFITNCKFNFIEFFNYEHNKDTNLILFCKKEQYIDWVNRFKIVDLDKNSIVSNWNVICRPIYDTTLYQMFLRQGCIIYDTYLNNLGYLYGVSISAINSKYMSKNDIALTIKRFNSELTCGTYIYTTSEINENTMTKNIVPYLDFDGTRNFYLVLRVSEDSFFKNIGITSNIDNTISVPPPPIIDMSIFDDRNVDVDNENDTIFSIDIYLKNCINDLVRDSYRDEEEKYRNEYPLFYMDNLDATNRNKIISGMCKKYLDQTVNIPLYIKNLFNSAKYTGNFDVFKLFYNPNSDEISSRSAYFINIRNRVLSYGSESYDFNIPWYFEIPNIPKRIPKSPGEVYISEVGRESYKATADFNDRLHPYAKRRLKALIFTLIVDDSVFSKLGVPENKIIAQYPARSRIKFDYAFNLSYFYDLTFNVGGNIISYLDRTMYVEDIRDFLPQSNLIENYSLLPIYRLDNFTKFPVYGIDKNVNYFDKFYKNEIGYFYDVDNVAFYLLKHNYVSERSKKILFSYVKSSVGNREIEAESYKSPFIKVNLAGLPVHYNFALLKEEYYGVPLILLPSLSVRPFIVTTSKFNKKQYIEDFLSFYYGDLICFNRNKAKYSYSYDFLQYPSFNTFYKEIPDIGEPDRIINFQPFFPEEHYNVDLAHEIAFLKSNPYNKEIKLLNSTIFSMPYILRYINFKHKLPINLLYLLMKSKSVVKLFKIVKRSTVFKVNNDMSAMLHSTLNDINNINNTNDDIFKKGILLSRLSKYLSEISKNGRLTVKSVSLLRSIANSFYAWIVNGIWDNCYIKYVDPKNTVYKVFAPVISPATIFLELLANNLNYSYVTTYPHTGENIVNRGISSILTSWCRENFIKRSYFSLNREKMFYDLLDEIYGVEDKTIEYITVTYDRRRMYYPGWLLKEYPYLDFGPSLFGHTHNPFLETKIIKSEKMTPRQREKGLYKNYLYALISYVKEDYIISNMQVIHTLAIMFNTATYPFNFFGMKYKSSKMFCADGYFYNSPSERSIERYSGRRVYPRRFNIPVPPTVVDTVYDYPKVRKSGVKTQIYPNELNDILSINDLCSIDNYDSVVYKKYGINKGVIGSSITDSDAIIQGCFLLPKSLYSTVRNILLSRGIFHNDEYIDYYYPDFKIEPLRIYFGSVKEKSEVNNYLDINSNKYSIVGSINDGLYLSRDVYNEANLPFTIFLYNAPDDSNEPIKLSAKGKKYFLGFEPGNSSWNNMCKNLLDAVDPMSDKCYVLSPYVTGIPVFVDNEFDIESFIRGKNFDEFFDLSSFKVMYKEVSVQQTIGDRTNFTFDESSVYNLFGSDKTSEWIPKPDQNINLPEIEYVEGDILKDFEYFDQIKNLTELDESFEREIKVIFNNDATEFYGDNLDVTRRKWVYTNDNSSLFRLNLDIDLITQIVKYNYIFDRTNTSVSTIRPINLRERIVKCEDDRKLIYSLSTYNYMRIYDFVFSDTSRGIDANINYVNKPPTFPYILGPLYCSLVNAALANMSIKYKASDNTIYDRYYNNLKLIDAYVFPYPIDSGKEIFLLGYERFYIKILIDKLGYNYYYRADNTTFVEICNVTDVLNKVKDFYPEIFKLVGKTAHIIIKLSNNAEKQCELGEIIDIKDIEILGHPFFELHILSNRSVAARYKKNISYLVVKDENNNFLYYTTGDTTNPTSSSYKVPILYSYYDDNNAMFSATFIITNRPSASEINQSLVEYCFSRDFLDKKGSMIYITNSSGIVPLAVYRNYTTTKKVFRLPPPNSDITTYIDTIVFDIPLNVVDRLFNNRLEDMFGVYYQDTTTLATDDTNAYFVSNRIRPYKFLYALFGSKYTIPLEVKKIFMDVMCKLRIVYDSSSGNKNINKGDVIVGHNGEYVGYITNVYGNDYVDMKFFSNYTTRRFLDNLFRVIDDTQFSLGFNPLVFRNLSSFIIDRSNIGIYNTGFIEFITNKPHRPLIKGDILTRNNRIVGIVNYVEQFDKSTYKIGVDNYSGSIIDSILDYSYLFNVRRKFTYRFDESGYIHVDYPCGIITGDNIIFDFTNYSSLYYVGDKTTIINDIVDIYISNSKYRIDDDESRFSYSLSGVPLYGNIIGYFISSGLNTEYYSFFSYDSSWANYSNNYDLYIEVFCVDKWIPLGIGAVSTYYDANNIPYYKVTINRICSVLLSMNVKEKFRITKDNTSVVFDSYVFTRDANVSNISIDKDIVVGCYFRLDKNVNKIFNTTSLVGKKLYFDNFTSLWGIIDSIYSDTTNFVTYNVKVYARKYFNLKIVSPAIRVEKEFNINNDYIYQFIKGPVTLWYKNSDNIIDDDAAELVKPYSFRYLNISTGRGTYETLVKELSKEGHVGSLYGIHDFLFSQFISSLLVEGLYLRALPNDMYNSPSYNVMSLLFERAHSKYLQDIEYYRSGFDEAMAELPPEERRAYMLNKYMTLNNFIYSNIPVRIGCSGIERYLSEFQPNDMVWLPLSYNEFGDTYYSTAFLIENDINLNEFYNRMLSVLTKKDLDEYLDNNRFIQGTKYSYNPMLRGIPINNEHFSLDVFLSKTYINKNIQTYFLMNLDSGRILKSFMNYSPFVSYYLPQSLLNIEFPNKTDISSEEFNKMKTYLINRYSWLFYSGSKSPKFNYGEREIGHSNKNFNGLSILNNSFTFIDRFYFRLVYLPINYK